MLRSQLLSAHTHAHTKLAANVDTHTRSHPVRQSRSRTPLQQSFCVVVFGGQCFKPRGRRSRERGRRKERKRRSCQELDAKFAAVVLHSIHQKGVRLSMSRRRTLLMWSSFKRGHLSDQDPCGAMPKWMYCKRGNTIQPLVLKSRWEGKSHQSLEFVGVSVVVFFVFFLFFKFGNGCRHEGTGSWERDRKHKEVSTKVRVSRAQMKGKLKAGLHETIPPKHHPECCDSARRRCSIGGVFTFRSSFCYKYMHQTYMLTTRAFHGTQRPHNTPHPLPSSCSRSSSRQIGSGGADLSSSSPGSGVLSSGSRCRGR